jgi:mannose-6-phosphate isomerase-like protein (cupin superfamily)
VKRSSALASLSRDHRQALFISHKLRKACPETADRVRIDLRAYWDEHGGTHFRAEEEVLFPAYAARADPYDPLLARLLCDHVAIRHRIQALDHDSPQHSAALHELGRLINQHVRLEERELFPLIEAALPDPELAAVVSALEQTTTTTSVTDDVNTPADLDRPPGVGPVWGMASEDLNATMLCWDPGDGVAEHVNDERDVLIIVIGGTGTVVVDGREHALRSHHALLIEKGARRRISAGATGLRYASVHQRRGPLEISTAPDVPPTRGPV